MAAVSNDRRFECADELSSSLERFLNCFQAARVVISRVHAILIDCRGGAQNAQRIEEPHAVPLLGKPNRYGRPIDTCPRNRNSYTHVHPTAAAALCHSYRVEFVAELDATGTSIPSRIR